MSVELLLTALAMGLAGGPHCVAMCGAACGAVCSAGSSAPGMTRSRALQPSDGAGLRMPASGLLAVVALPGQSPAALKAGATALRAGSTSRSMLLFQAGRLAGYSALGALAAASVQGLGWMSTHVAALRPLWTLMHAAALLLGLALLWQGRQPAWMQGAAQWVWAAVRRVVPTQGSAPAAVGVLWALMPCGLLYSALMVAALAGTPWQGALVMAAFAAGSGAVLAAGPWAWSWLRRRGGAAGGGAGGGAGEGAWGVRLAGLCLAVLSGWALWMGMTGRIAAWCVT